MHKTFLLEILNENKKSRSAKQILFWKYICYENKNIILSVLYIAGNICDTTFKIGVFTFINL